jgi:hypothetical protein
MREATNKQKPSSEEGGQVKKGDKAWVLCRVIEPCESLMKVTGSGDDNWFWASRKHCRPVEPLAKEPTRGQKLAEQALKGIWAANDSVYGDPSGGWEPTKDEIEYAINRCGVPISDPINPAHYKQGGIECIEAIKAALGDGFPDYLRGNVMKYLWRYKEKGGVDDLRKSAWYLDRLFREAGE